MKKYAFTISRSWLPLLAVLMLAFVFSQFSIEANAVTVSTSSAADCCAPCDPANCPMPCAIECTGSKSNACPSEKACGSMGDCKTASVKTVSAVSADCPAPCAATCDMVKASNCGAAVAQVK